MYRSELLMENEAQFATIAVSRKWTAITSFVLLSFLVSRMRRACHDERSTMMLSECFHEESCYQIDDTVPIIGPHFPSLLIVVLLRC